MKTGLFRAIRKRLSLVHDNDMGAFREKLDLLVSQKDTLGDDEIAAKVDELKALCADLPESEEKAKLDRFLDDFNQVKGQDANVAKEAAGAIADLFEKLDTEAMKDSPSVDTPAEAPATETTEVVEETEAPDTDDAEPPTLGEYMGNDAKADVEHVTQTKDDDGDDAANAEYTLEEIYQFIKKRLAEDAACDEEKPEEEQTADEGDEVVEEKKEDQEEEKKEDEITTDHAPFIPVTMTKDHGSKNGLGALLAMAKGE